MGKKKEALTRVVLDTNVLVSTLLFGGRLDGLREAWRRGRFRLLLCRETADELLRVLAYPKFRLTKAEITALFEREVLPFAEVVDPGGLPGSWCRDPDDDAFLRCALAGGAGWLVSGDADLLVLRRVETVRIVSPAEYLDVIAKNIEGMG